MVRDGTRATSRIRDRSAWYQQSRCPPGRLPATCQLQTRVARSRLGTRPGSRTASSTRPCRCARQRPEALVAAEAPALGLHACTRSQVLAQERPSLRRSSSRIGRRRSISPSCRYGPMKPDCGATSGRLPHARDDFGPQLRVGQRVDEACSVRPHLLGHALDLGDVATRGWPVTRAHRDRGFDSGLLWS